MAHRRRRKHSKANPARRRRVHARRRSNPVKHTRRVRRHRARRARSNSPIIRRRKRSYRHRVPGGRIKSYRTRLINPIGKVSGMFRLPTVQELLWVSVGALGVPTVNRFITNLIPLEAVKSGYGNIATEFLIGSLASGAARKYAGSTAGDVLFTLVLARTIGRVAFKVSGGSIGFEDVDFYQPGQMEFYQPGQMDYTGTLPGFGGSDAPETMPSMTE